MVVADGKLVTTNLVDINLNIRILLGSSYYDDWEDGETFVKNDPLGNPVDKRHPWNQTTNPKPQKRDFAGKYTWVMSPGGITRPPRGIWRWTLAVVPIARFCNRNGQSGGRRLPQGDGQKRKDFLPKTVSFPKLNWSGRLRNGATRLSVTVRAPTSRPTLLQPLCTL